ncbi:unnamed protein product [Ambrosiozyma monospora]|uniref:Unnamed protein product n=1 Tax=Ambrosiozyma monospora TaxID=43982 RepID=A0ACB5TBJ6_AMBMO|nr:unnamed protein product [Ambrosiozyma monospora]
MGCELSEIGARVLAERSNSNLPPARSDLKLMKVKMGIPQGNPIYCLLFLIYTTPLIQSLNRSCNVKAVGFMDDWTFYQEGNQFERNTNEIEEAYTII